MSVPAADKLRVFAASACEIIAADLLEAIDALLDQPETNPYSDPQTRVAYRSGRADLRDDVKALLHPEAGPS